MKALRLLNLLRVREVLQHPPIRCKSFNINSSSEFNEKVMNSTVPVVVNFHAEWCDPCHILTPKLRELLESSEQVNLAIVDVESNADLVHTFEVKAVPAVIGIKDGLVIDKFIGLVEHDAIIKLVNKLLDHKFSKTK
ncbi:thioredoxin, mitochondrial [Halyomorpha halys]|uniref:thioredoxin, mitochondrial n=1 Tax=Halyomorpha halys TaxID=286706 RepID=UPI0006D4E634|nr:thioredoxin, mitochondrial [Halyomorpha halys]XP_014273574.1 thioredoxin, mitochondrial [Halyomorpha halys]